MFWQSLLLIEKIYFIIACVGSVLLVIQLILLLIGGAGDGNVDGVDAEVDGDGGIGIFTIKGLIAFFAIGGWVGLAVSKSGLHWGWSVAIAVLCGLVAFVAVGFAYKAMLKLQSNGSMNMKNAIGKTAEVYLTIPKANEGHGKINVVLQGKLIEADAITKEEEPIKTGDFVVINDVIGEVYIVARAIDNASVIQK